VLLLWPRFYSKYPPVGLLRIASYHKDRGDGVVLSRGVDLFGPEGGFDRVYVTSLFTYDSAVVVQEALAAKARWPQAEVMIGGLWASLMPDDCLRRTGIHPHVGLFHPAEGYPPDWSLDPGGRISIVFASRGCIRRCPWCAVWKHEPEFVPKTVEEVLAQIDPLRPRVEFWDNNFTAHPRFGEIIEALVPLGKKVDFTQGLDARLLDREKVKLLTRLDLEYIRLAYDHPAEGEAVRQAIACLHEAGFGSGQIIVYCLYNFYDPRTGQGDTPEEFYKRLDDIQRWGARAYPMRYRPVDSTDKYFVSPLWGEEELYLFNRARGAIGRGTGIITLGHFSMQEFLARRVRFKHPERQPALL